MKPQLHTLDYAREILARSEPLSTFEFSVGNTVRFRLAPGWQHGVDARGGNDLVDAYIQFSTGLSFQEFQLTKDALLEATSICGLPKTYAARCPCDLLEVQLNYWFREGLGNRRAVNRDFQLLVAAGHGAAITRASIIPFSNLLLLEQALNGIEARYGAGEVLVDHKFSHSLRRTHLRLIIPDHTRTMTGTGIADDTWSIGLQIKNSLIGEERTSIDGYLFRWVCANGQTDTQASPGAWRRNPAGRGNEAEVYEWARHVVDDVLGGLEPSLDAVQRMTDIPVQEATSDVLRDVFEHYRVSLPERGKIMEQVLNAAGDLTMYGVMAAITQVANDPDLEPSHIDNLLRMGGDLPYAANSRCESCRRLMKH